MSNMSYCRFRNTAFDLRDCAEWLRENEPSELSEDEQKAFKILIMRCIRLADDYRDQFEEEA